MDASVTPSPSPAPPPPTPLTPSADHRAPCAAVGWAILVVAGGVGLACLVVIGSKWVPLGVPGEWEWLRPRLGVEPDRFVIGIAGVVIHTLLLGLLIHWAKRTAGSGQQERPRRAAEVGMVVLATASALMVQLAIQWAAPVGHGLEKWVFVTLSTGSTGYYDLAAEVEDFTAFLKDYDSWIPHQDALHIGTHPPGLFVLCRGVRDLCRHRADLTSWLLTTAPSPTRQALRVWPRATQLEPSGHAAVVLLGWLTLAASAATAIPLYTLARIGGLDAAASLGVIGLWAVAPAPILFQPVSDTLYPLLAVGATTAAVLAWEFRGTGWGWTNAILAVGAGMLLGVGMSCTLAFLAVGFNVALVLTWLGRTRSKRRRTVRALGWIGLGFAAWTGLTAWVWGCDLLTIWRANLANHARFYEEYPRDYAAWVLINPLEAAVAVGPVAAVAIVAGLAVGAVGLVERGTVPSQPISRNRAWLPAVAITTLLTLTLLNVSGRNLSEVARLWLPLLPTLLTAIGPALAIGLKATGLIMLGGMFTLVLQTLIQVVLPV